MAVNFKIYQSNRKGNTNGKFYARAAHRETINTKDLAEVMQNNSTVKRSDIVAVLTELSEVLRQELQRSNKVHIDGIGTFKVGIRSKGAKTAKEFNATDNIVGSHTLHARNHHRRQRQPRQGATCRTQGEGGCKLREPQVEGA